ncbi:hypothetical protein MCERE19_02804 [Spirosomataceae bacterium]|jgi:hypothetical protein
MHAIISYPEKKEDIDALKAFLKALKIKFEDREVSNYDNEFISKIQNREELLNKGEFITIKDTDNIWKSILSE